MQRAYFLGGASPSGFETAFWSEHSAYYGFYLKGGPGTGKSTLLKKIASAFSGERVSVYHCASDPHSLDAVVLEDRGVFLADATAPHESSTPLPYVTGETVDLAAGLKTERLAEHRQKILDLYAQNKAAHAQARRGLSGISDLLDTAAAAGQSALNRDKLERYAARFARRLLPRGSGTGRVLSRQCSAVTPQGRLTLLPEDYDWILLRDDALAASQTLLALFVQKVADSGLTCEVTHALTQSSRPVTHVILPERRLAVIAGAAGMSAPLRQPLTAVSMNRFYDAALLKEHRELLRFCTKTAASVEETTVGLLADALRSHDALEDYYIAALHKPYLDRQAAETVRRILSRTERQEGGKAPE